MHSNVVKASLFLLTIVILFMIYPIGAYANGGPLYYPASGYGLLQLDEQSNISLVREKVSYTLKGDTSSYQSAEVSVQYELKSGNDFNVTTDVLFITSPTEKLSVIEGNHNLETSLVPNSKPVNWHAPMKYTVADPVSGESLQLSSQANNEAVGNRFSLSFEPNETKHILIQYIETGGMYDKGVINTIFSHLYYLTPAKFWDGEPQVELEVKLSAPNARIHSNLPLEQIDSTTYRTEFNELPEEEWYFSYTYPKRLIFPTNIEKEHNLLTLSTALVASAIAAGLALLFRKRVIFISSSIIIMIFTVYYISKMGGYPFDAIFVGFTDTAVCVVLLLCNILIWKRIGIKQKKQPK
ncbi:MAG: hypothetical protein ACE3L7_13245 [Candidatus Pristimantibacillus sp.]